MKLFIRIKDGQPFEHPILESNFKQAFPKVDTENLPPEFAEFQRIEQPSINVYEVYEGVTYELDGNIVKDVHHVRAMTNEEKTEKQNEIKEQWTQNGGFASWTFDEETCSFVPPIPYPDDGLFYIWNEESLSWVQPQEGVQDGS